MSQKVAEIVANLRASAGLSDFAVPVIGVLPFEVLKAKQLIHDKAKVVVTKSGSHGSPIRLADWNAIFEKHVPVLAGLVLPGKAEDPKFAKATQNWQAAFGGNQPGGNQPDFINVSNVLCFADRLCHPRSVIFAVAQGLAMKRTMPPY